MFRPCKKAVLGGNLGVNKGKTVKRRTVQRGIGL